MKILKLMTSNEGFTWRGMEKYLVGIILILSWITVQRVLQSGDVSIAVIDPSIWLLVLLSLICFVTVTGISFWILKRFAVVMGLPTVGNLIVQFNSLELWQQLGFYWASFALLLLAGVGSLSAIL
ncbi:MAG TPA: hypothetical protein VF679_11135 [Pedobacter sp.]|jgi:hypothetical protein